MADDAGARSAFPLNKAKPTVADRRGPLRPARLQSARNRISGVTVARFFQLGDVLGLAAASFAASRLAHAAHAEPLVLGAPFIAVFVLLATGAYKMRVREPLARRLARAAL